MLVQDMGVSGGYHKLVIRLAQQLTELGHEVTTYTPYVDAEKCYPEMINSVKIVTLPPESTDIYQIFRSGLWAETKAALTLSGVRNAKALAKLIDPDLDLLIVHNTSNLLHVNFYHPTKKDFRCVWMFNCEIPQDFGQFSPRLKTLFPKGLGTRGRLMRALCVPSAMLETWLESRGVRYIDKCATYDSYNQKLVEKRLGKETVNIYAGADLEKYSAVKKMHKAPSAKEFRILSVGVLFPYRRYEDLIEAAAILNDAGKPVEVTIVGSKKFAPQYYDELIALAKKRGVDKHVTIKDYLTDEEMLQQYAEADAFVFINDGLTWGISVFEAVAADLPLVITDNIGAADLITDGKDGLVVPARSPKAVSEAISRYVDDRNFARKMAEKAHEDVEQIVSWRAFAERMLALAEGGAQK
jgi:glycosyltransferase involved in cell wall biosynthesis